MFYKTPVGNYREHHENRQGQPAQSIDYVALLVIKAQVADLLEDIEAEIEVDLKNGAEQGVEPDHAFNFADDLLWQFSTTPHDGASNVEDQDYNTSKANDVECCQQDVHQQVSAAEFSIKI